MTDPLMVPFFHFCVRPTQTVRTSPAKNVLIIIIIVGRHQAFESFDSTHLEKSGNLVATCANRYAVLRIQLQERFGNRLLNILTHLACEYLFQQYPEVRTILQVIPTLLRCGGWEGADSKFTEKKLLYLNIAKPFRKTLFTGSTWRRQLFN